MCARLGFVIIICPMFQDALIINNLKGKSVCCASIKVREVDTTGPYKLFSTEIVGAPRPNIFFVNFLEGQTCKCYGLSQIFPSYPGLNGVRG